MPIVRCHHRRTAVQNPGVMVARSVRVPFLLAVLLWSSAHLDVARSRAVGCQTSDCETVARSRPMETEFERTTENPVAGIALSAPATRVQGMLPMRRGRKQQKKSTAARVRGALLSAGAALGILQGRPLVQAGIHQRPGSTTLQPGPCRSFLSTPTAPILSATNRKNNGGALTWLKSGASVQRNSVLKHYDRRHRSAVVATQPRTQLRAGNGNKNGAGHDDLFRPGKDGNYDRTHFWRSNSKLKGLKRVFRYMLTRKAQHDAQLLAAQWKLEEVRWKLEQLRLDHKTADMKNASTMGVSSDAADDARDMTVKNASSPTSAGSLSTAGSSASSVVSPNSKDPSLDDAARRRGKDRLPLADPEFFEDVHDLEQERDGNIDDGFFPGSDSDLPGASGPPRNYFNKNSSSSSSASASPTPPGSGEDAGGKDVEGTTSRSTSDTSRRMDNAPSSEDDQDSIASRIDWHTTGTRRASGFYFQNPKSHKPERAAREGRVRRRAGTDTKLPDQDHDDVLSSPEERGRAEDDAESSSDDGGGGWLFGRGHRSRSHKNAKNDRKNNENADRAKSKNYNEMRHQDSRSNAERTVNLNLTPGEQEALSGDAGGDSASGAVGSKGRDHEDDLLGHFAHFGTNASGFFEDDFSGNYEKTDRGDEELRQEESPLLPSLSKVLLDTTAGREALDELFTYWIVCPLDTHRDPELEFLVKEIELLFQEDWANCVEKRVLVWARSHAEKEQMELQEHRAYLEACWALPAVNRDEMLGKARAATEAEANAELEQGKNKANTKKLPPAKPPVLPEDMKGVLDRIAATSRITRKVNRGNRRSEGSSSGKNPRAATGADAAPGPEQRSGRSPTAANRTSPEQIAGNKMSEHDQSCEDQSSSAGAQGNDRKKSSSEVEDEEGDT